MFATILAIIKAIPAIKSMIDEFVSLYIAQEISNMKTENQDAIRKAIDTHDQRAIEHAIGSDKEGKLSGESNAHVVHDLPGVHKPRKD